MPRKKRDDHEGAIHHVYGRGNRRQTIFHDDLDCRSFLSRILRYEAEHGIVVLAYCLMVNHYHLVLQSLNAELSAFMQELLGSYTQAHNERHETVGHVFQGRFGSRRCKTNLETMVAIRYVHLNPIEARLAASPELWKWSSDPGIRAGTDPIVAADQVLELFGGLGAYVDFMSQTARPRRSLDEIAVDILGPTWRDRQTAAEDAAHRELVCAAISEGYRRSDLARYLGRSPVWITRLLAN